MPFSADGQMAEALGDDVRSRGTQILKFPFEG